MSVTRCPSCGEPLGTSSQCPSCGRQLVPSEQLEELAFAWLHGQNLPPEKASLPREWLGPEGGAAGTSAAAQRAEHSRRPSSTSNTAQQKTFRSATRRQSATSRRTVVRDQRPTDRTPDSPPAQATVAKRPRSAQLEAVEAGSGQRDVRARHAAHSLRWLIYGLVLGGLLGATLAARWVQHRYEERFAQVEHLLRTQAKWLQTETGRRIELELRLADVGTAESSD